MGIFLRKLRVLHSSSSIWETNMKTPAELEYIKKRLTTKYIEDLATLYTREVHKVIDWFHCHYPKRSIRWMSGMGTCFWVVDDEIMYWNKRDDPGRHDRALAPLWDLYLSITDTSSIQLYNICTGNISDTPNTQGEEIT